MINPFKEIQNNHSISKAIKKSVLDDVVMIAKTIEFHKFILKKYPNTLSSCFKE